MAVRNAVQQDIVRMVELSEAKRVSYESHSPLFWRKAENSAQVQSVFFEKLLEQPDWLLLVHEHEGVIDGFIIGRLMLAPPVYNPGGKACLIDDFTVTDPSHWASTGVTLHQALEAQARQAGAVVSITVSGAHDGPKRSALLGAGAHLASEWYTHAIPTHES